jgi:hypothetical protein
MRASEAGISTLLGGAVKGLGRAGTGSKFSAVAVLGDDTAIRPAKNRYAARGRIFAHFRADFTLKGLDDNSGGVLIKIPFV